jgi:hypothetical protein
MDGQYGLAGEMRRRDETNPTDLRTTNQEEVIFPPHPHHLPLLRVDEDHIGGDEEKADRLVRVNRTARDVDEFAEDFVHA